MLPVDCRGLEAAIAVLTVPAEIGAAAGFSVVAGSVAAGLDTAGCSFLAVATSPRAEDSGSELYRKALRRPLGIRSRSG
jgi:hypothetical protein